MNIDIDKIFQEYSDETFIIADGFDDAILGIDEKSNRVIYSIDKCLQILLSQGMSATEAVEYFDFNVAGSYIGEKTPIWCDDTMFVSNRVE